MDGRRNRVMLVFGHGIHGNTTRGSQPATLCLVTSLRRLFSMADRRREARDAILPRMDANQARNRPSRLHVQKAKPARSGPRLLSFSTSPALPRTATTTLVCWRVKDRRRHTEGRHAFQHQVAADARSRQSWCALSLICTNKYAWRASGEDPCYPDGTSGTPGQARCSALRISARSVSWSAAWGRCQAIEGARLPACHALLSISPGIVAW
jgi:hypothetical protein